MELTDEEMVKHYSTKLKSFGNESVAYYYSGFAIFCNDKIHSTQFNEDPFILTSYVNFEKWPKYNAFDQMRKSIKTGKYYCDMTDEEISESEKSLETNLKKFIKSTFEKINENKNLDK